MSLRTERMLTTSVNQSGHRYTHLVHDSGKGVSRSVGMLVAKAFLDAPPMDHYNSVIYKNGDKLDASITNLAWRPRWFAIDYHKQFQHPSILYSKNRVIETQTNAVYDNLLEAAVDHGVLWYDIKNSVEHGNGYVRLGGDAIFEYL